MKITTFLIFAAFMQVSAASVAQKLTLVKKNVTLKEVFKEINKQTGYNIFGSDEQINKKIDVNFKDAGLMEVLDKCLENTSLTYTIEDKTVVIKEKEPTIIDKIKTAMAAPITISGKVTDETGQPLSGVTVKEKGTNNLVISDLRGGFSITVSDNNIVVTFSFVGFETKEVVTKELGNPATVVLKVSTTNLKEVVVNKGYYNTTRELNTGDVSSVSANDIGKQPISNPLAALEGRVSGLYITQSSGVPGSNFTVRLRGQNSIANGNDPLYIIDGVPYPSNQLTSQQGFVQRSGSSPLDYINPSDIANIDVLKDADATSIYGSRGANGVILITTKKGVAGKEKVSFNIYEGAGQVSHMVDLLNTQQYLNMRHQAFKNDGATPGSFDYDLTSWDTTRNTNWQKALIGGTAHITDAQGSISGGDVNTQYLIGGGYHRETTVFPGNFSDKKASAHFNLTHTSSNHKFNAVFSSSFVANDNNLPNQDLTYLALTLAPDAPPLYSSDGKLNWQNFTWTNPLSYTQQTYQAKTTALVSNAVLNYEVLPGLQLKTNLGYTTTEVKEQVLIPISSQGDAATIALYPQYFKANATLSNNSLNTWIVEPQINFKKDWGKNHLDMLAGATFQQDITQGSTINGANIGNDALILDLSAAPTVTVNNNFIDYRYNALFGRINYNLDDKYLINLTARRDGSSRFGPGKQFGNFGAVGAAWIFYKEDFIRNALPFLSFGKLRSSYGITGNDQTNDYQFYDTYSSTNNPYAGVGGLIPTRLFNPNFGWETNKKIEVGIELGFLNDRILLTTNYYRNRSSNQLVGYPLPPTTGETSVVENFPADVQNTGLEFDLNTVNIKDGNFRWTSSINLTIPRNKLISYPNIAGTSYANIYVVGQSLFIEKLYHETGVDKTTGLYNFQDYNGDGQITSPADQQSIKFVGQYFYGGLQNAFQYNGWKLDFLFQFVKQNAQNYIAGFSTPGYAYNQPIQVLNNWQKPGEVSSLQGFTAGYNSAASTSSNLAKNSDLGISDASFIRLKNLALSYQLPTTFLNHLHIQSSRIYLQGENLLTFTKYIGPDPEQPFIRNLPSLKILTLGIQLSF